MYSIYACQLNLCLRLFLFILIFHVLSFNPVSAAKTESSKSISSFESNKNNHKHNTNSYAVSILQLTLNEERYDLNPFLRIFEDFTNKLSIDDIIDYTSKDKAIVKASNNPGIHFVPLAVNSFDLGKKNSAIWLKFSIDPSARSNDSWVLRLQDYHWKSIQIHYQMETGEWVKINSGRELRYDPGNNIGNHFYFNLTNLSSKKSNVFLRLTSDAEMKLNLGLNSKSVQQSIHNYSFYFQGILHGILLLMALYNFLFYLSIHDKSYLFYSLYVMALALYFMSDDGVFKEILWDQPNLVYIKYSASMFFVFELFFVGFVKSFLLTNKNIPRMNKMLNVSMVVSSLALISFLSISDSTIQIQETLASKVMVFSVLLMIICVFASGILCVRIGYAPARFFLIAASIFIVAIMLASLEALKVFSENGTGIYLMKVGAIIEAVLYSFALADRFKYERRLKEESQQKAIDEQISMTKTFEKFVPRQFLNRVAKKGIQSIQLGNVENEYVAILFSDIRSFTTLSEKMSPQEVFDFLNSYMSKMEPPIVKQNGFVDKFIGDAIMALFDTNENSDKAHNAVDAALGMQRALVEFNKLNLGKPHFPIATGIGIHSGNVMIGTVGSTQRMDSTAIGDAVNLASRIEGMTKEYNKSILISESTYNDLSQPERYQIRKVASVIARGKSNPINIYEVANSASKSS